MILWEGAKGGGGGGIHDVGGVTLGKAVTSEASEGGGGAQGSRGLHARDTAVVDAREKPLRG